MDVKAAWKQFVEENTTSICEMKCSVRTVTENPVGEQ
jgi:hypothetical protein